MITIKFDQQFQTDFKRISRRKPQIVTELEYVIEAIEEYGHVPESYNPHMLDRPRGIYSGYAEFHLAEGKNGCVGDLLGAAGSVDNPIHSHGIPRRTV